jgi:hypothetical protein
MAKPQLLQCNANRAWCHGHLQLGHVTWSDSCRRSIISSNRQQLNPIIRDARRMIRRWWGDIIQSGLVLTGRKRNFQKDKTEQLCRWVLSAE